MWTDIGQALFLGKMDWEGDVYWQKIKPDTALYHNWPTSFGVNGGYNNSSLMSSKGNLVTCTNSKWVTLGEKSKCTYTSFRPDGTLNFFYRFPSSDSISDVASDIVETADSGFALVSTHNITIPNNFTNYGLKIRKLDKDGIFQWRKEYTNGQQLSPNCIATDEHGHIYIGAHFGNISFRSEDFENKSMIYKLDSLGNIIKTYISPDSNLYLTTQDIIPTKDGGIIYVSQIGLEYKQSGRSEIKIQTRLTKLDSNFQKEWETSLDTFSSVHKFHGIIPLQDGSILAYGATYNEELGNSSIHKYVGGWVAKLASNGDSLWMRIIRHSPITHNANFYHGTEAPDGGFLMVGYIDEFDGQFPLRGAWWVKLDSMGCLVPGCHLKVGIDDDQNFNFDFSLYPNPAKDQLFIHIKNPERHQLHFQILNTSGQILQENKLLTFTDITQGFSVESWASGVYFVRLLSEDGHSQMKKFIIE